MKRKRKIYVATSWRNKYQENIVKALRADGHEVYNFKNPKEDDKGFHWSEIDPNWEKWTPEEYRKNLNHPIAKAGFKSDYEAMEWADTCVLVMPCGRSAHIEAGYFVGAHKELIILIDVAKPELMYKLADHIAVNLGEVIILLNN